MSYSILIRLGGLAAMVGSVGFAVSGSLLAPQEGRWFVVLFLLGMMAVIVALHLLQRERGSYGLGGAIASAIALVGVVLTLGGYILVDFIISLEGIGTLVVLVGALAATLGVIGLASATLTAGVLPRWAGVALILGNPLLAVLIIVIFYGTGFRGVGWWLVALPWVVVGFAVVRAAGRRAEQPARVR
jgi:uncharacterized membrane protein YhdT